ncbi:MAG: DUF1269 domain-containing protein [Thermomicrobiales bacterium]
MAVIDKGHLTDWPQSLIWAVFDTWYGAADALEELKRADRAWLIDIDNAAVISKNMDGGIEFNETKDRTTLAGLGKGAIIGGIVGLIFPPALIASTAAGAAMGGLGARLRDAGFEDNALRAVAEQLEPNQSLLVAVIWHQWTDDVVRYLDEIAYRVGWTEISKQAAEALFERQTA